MIFENVITFFFPFPYIIALMFLVYFQKCHYIFFCLLANILPSCFQMIFENASTFFLPFPNIIVLIFLADFPKCHYIFFVFFYTGIPIHIIWREIESFALLLWIRPLYIRITDGSSNTTSSNGIKNTTWE